MSKMRGVSYYLANALSDPAVVDVLKRWQTIADDLLHCPDYVLEFGFLL